MNDEFSRTRMLLGGEGMERLRRARVALFGLGGVGGYALEALLRSGVGALDLVDHDTIAPSNLNRQLLALHSTLGMSKTEAARARAADVAPETAIRCYPVFFTPQNADDFCFSDYDYVIDAIDTVTAKLALVCRAKAAGVPVISCMGTGNRLDPARLRITDLSETSGCPLARVMRKELRRRGIEHLKVLASTELPHVEEESGETRGSQDRPVPGSVAFVPSVAGLMIASEVIRELAGLE